MNMGALKRALCAIAILLALPTVCSFAQKLPPCSEQRVTYEPFDDRFASNFVSEPGPPIAVAASEKQFSPERTNHIVVANPDYTKPGPWKTVVWIGSSGQAPTHLLTFLDHATGGVKLQWLNEKLLYGSVWWGRIVATDFVFDVQRKTFIYREMANYGAIVQPCQRGEHFR